MAITKRQRGRKSAAALATRAQFPLTLPRLQPPVELTGEEKEIWTLVVNDLPADWISPAATPLLVQLCRHCVQARRIAELVEQAAGNRETVLSYYQNLLGLQARESAAITSLSTKLRLGPSSIRNNRGNLVQQAPPRRVPWENNPLIGGAAFGGE
jgi:hypothetical protein